MSTECKQTLPQRLLIYLIICLLLSYPYQVPTQLIPRPPTILSSSLTSLS